MEFVVTTNMECLYNELTYNMYMLFISRISCRKCVYKIYLETHRMNNFFYWEYRPSYVFSQFMNDTEISSTNTTKTSVCSLNFPFLQANIAIFKAVLPIKITVLRDVTLV